MSGAQGTIHVASGRGAGVAALVACILFAIMVPATLVWTWFHPPPGPSDFYALGGRLPWSDGFDYWGSAQHLMQQGRLDEWGSRRPINGAMLAARLRLAADHLLAANLLQSIALGIVLGGAAALGILRLGIVAGLLFGVAMLVPVAIVQSTTQSEGLGVMIGLGGTVALLASARGRLGLGSAFLGFSLLSLAMAARPGALFMLPALGLGAIAAQWVASRSGEWTPGRAFRAPLVAIVVVAIGIGVALGVNAGIRLLAADPAVRANANFAGTLLGIARGTDYYEADRWLRGELGDKATEGQRARLAYEQSWNLLMSDPGAAAAALTRNMVAFLGRAWPLLLLGMIGLVRSPRHERWFWISGWIGILLSVPVVFGDGGVRCLAVSWPFMLLSVSSAVRTRTFMSAQQEGVATAIASAPTLGLLILCFTVTASGRDGGVLPALPRRGTFEVDLSPAGGAEEVDWIRNAPALHMVLVAEESQRPDADARFHHLPWFTPAQLAARRPIIEFGEPLERVPGPYLLCVVYDIAQSRARVFTLPADGRTADAINAGSPVLRVDSVRLRDDGRVRVGVLVSPVPKERLPARTPSEARHAGPGRDGAVEQGGSGSG